MQLKFDLLAVMNSLGVTEPELEMLKGRMLAAVTGLTAQQLALDTQIATLTAQRDAVAAELAQANITVAKLIDQA